MNDKENTSVEKNKGGIKSRQQLYAMFSPHAELAIETLVKACSNGNPSVRVGAAKTILAKLVPDLKSTEILGQDGQQFTINIIRDYFTKARGNVSSSDTSVEGSEQIQGSSVAQTSEKDIDITGEDGNRVP
jgi:hypothetical protein